MISQLCVALVLVSGVFFSPQTAFAVKVFAGLGALETNTGKISKADDGTRGTVGPIFAEVGTVVQVPLWREMLFLEPNFTFTPFGLKTKDGDVTKSVFTLGVPLLFRPFPYFGLRAGTGMIFYLTSPKGGEVVLNNGTSTSTFAIPDNLSLSRLAFVSIGPTFQYWIARLDLEVLLTKPLSRARTFNFMGMISFQVWESSPKKKRSDSEQINRENIYEDNFY